MGCQHGRGVGGIREQGLGPWLRLTGMALGSAYWLRMNTVLTKERGMAARLRKIIVGCYGGREFGEAGSCGFLQSI